MLISNIYLVLAIIFCSCLFVKYDNISQLVCVIILSSVLVYMSKIYENLEIFTNQSKQTHKNGLLHSRFVFSDTKSKIKSNSTKQIKNYGKNKKIKFCGYEYKYDGIHSV